jgi:predicted Zn-dependent peptidase
MRRSNPAVWAFAALWLSLPAANAQSLEEFENRVTEATLSNGIRVILVEKHDAPVASFVNHVDVGGVNEVPGITGLAHLFEHMAFKGTHVIGTKDIEAERAAIARVDELYHELQKARPEGDEERVAELEAAFAEAQREAGSYVVANEFGQIIEREGGQGLNAFTSNDATVYFFSLPSNKVELWAYLESERYVHGVLREFYRERNVVMEERRMGAESQPIGRLLEQYIATAFTAHPYGQPVVGHMSDLQSLTREDASAFFERHYIPQNMTIAIVGDIEPQKTLEILEAYFGRIERGPTPQPIRTVEPKVPAERSVTLYDPGQPWYIAGYPIPSIRNDDYPALMALAVVLSSGRTSRLYKRLVTEQKIAFFAGAFPGFPGSKYPSQMIFYATTALGHTNDEIASSIETEIARIKTELVSDEELTRAKANLRASLVRQLDSNFGMALQLADYETVTGDWRNLFLYIDRIQELTAEDLRTVANEYLDNRYRTVGKIETVSEASPAGTN